MSLKLLVQSAMIFFGTLLAAGIVALGEPSPTGSEGGSDGSVFSVLGQWLGGVLPVLSVFEAGR